MRNNGNENDAPTAVTQDGQPAKGSYPAGISGLFGVEDSQGGGMMQAPSLAFMTAHTDDMQRLLAETILTTDMSRDIALMEAELQSIWGYVHFPVITKMRLAMTIGEGGQGRQDAKEVETIGVRSAIARGRGAIGRLFGMGGGDQQQAPQNNNSGAPGY